MRHQLIRCLFSYIWNSIFHSYCLPFYSDYIISIWRNIYIIYIDLPTKFKGNINLTKFENSLEFNAYIWRNIVILNISIKIAIHKCCILRSFAVKSVSWKKTILCKKNWWKMFAIFTRVKNIMTCKIIQVLTMVVNAYCIVY